MGRHPQQSPASGQPSEACSLSMQHAAAEACCMPSCSVPCSSRPGCRQGDCCGRSSQRHSAAANMACPSPLPLLGDRAAVRGGCRGRCRKRCNRRARGCWRACSARTAICRPLSQARPGLGPCLTPLRSTGICEQTVCSALT